MVPDAAEAVIEGPKNEEILSSFKDMLRTTDQKGEAAIENGQLILRMYGLSCHAMEPNMGSMPAFYCANFSSRLSLTMQESGLCKL